MKKTIKVNKHYYMLYIVMIFSIFNIICVNTSNSVSALTYQSTVGPEFTINPAISVSMSESDLIIDDLNPGTSSDSNIITITASSNSLGGYSLSSTVGSSTTNYTDLRLTSSDTTNKFTNLDSNKATLNNFDDNYWGYSYSTDDGTNWVSGDINDNPLAGYNGLPVYSNTGIKLVDSNTLGTSTIKFKIGAKASTSQVSGAYTNTVNFVTVANPTPTFCDSHTCMQDLTSSTIATLLPNVNDTATVYDMRDEQTYTIAKLADNKYWMVENLNLAGGTALSADDTDVTSDYISSFSTSNNLTRYGNTIVLPASSTSGFDTDNYSYVYNSGSTTCGSSSPCYSYYSWDAATLGSGRSISTDNTNAEQSICPKGWRLPTTYDGSGTAAAATDFRALMIAYGGSDSIQNYSATMYNNIKAGTTPNFLLGGYYYNSSFNYGGSGGLYWFATSGSSSTYARYLSFGSSYVNSADGGGRRLGFSVRCLFGS